VKIALCCCFFVFVGFSRAEKERLMMMLSPRYAMISTFLAHPRACLGFSTRYDVLVCYSKLPLQCMA
jgi:hypothetical protein